VIFGMEVISIRRLRFFAPLECVIASFTAYYTTILLRAPHTHYPAVSIPLVDFTNLSVVILAGIAFGLTANLFVRVTHLVERVQARVVKYPPLRPCLAGVALALLYYWEGTYQYAGLGIPAIQEALILPSRFIVPTLKLGFTALTIGSGFKGGEFIPLVFIGTTLGSALSSWLPVSTGLLAAVGFAAVFASGANTPIACSIMAMEMFGPRIAPFAFAACFAGYYVSGHHGIYSSQRVERRKWDWWKRFSQRARRRQNPK